MKVVITGGCGFLGLRLARSLLERGHLMGSDGDRAPIGSLVLADVTIPSKRAEWMDERVKLVACQVTDREGVSSLIDDDTSVFHLASIVSSQAEADPDLALEVNLDGTRTILNAVRDRRGGKRVVTTSSYAVFGGELPEWCGDRTKLTPQSTYGMTKAMLELLVNDYTRRGFIDGRVARLPTVIIRPGQANAAASSVASAVFREPLKGIAYEIPVSLTTRMAVADARTVVEGLVALHDADQARLGLDRSVTFPSRPYSIEEMLESLTRVARGCPLGTTTIRPDSAIGAIVSSWPVAVEFDRATAIGIPSPNDLDQIVRAYIDEFV